jgi:hypothetical protein
LNDAVMTEIFMQRFEPDQDSETLGPSPQSVKSVASDSGLGPQKLGIMPVCRA